MSITSLQGKPLDVTAPVTLDGESDSEMSFHRLMADDFPWFADGGSTPTPHVLPTNIPSPIATAPQARGTGRQPDRTRPSWTPRQSCSHLSHPPSNFRGVDFS